MAVRDQDVSTKHAIYNGDCIEVMSALPEGRTHFSIYSPPFGGLYHYSSDDRDLSNSRDYNQFFEHYRFVVRELFRLTLPGRLTAVHCMDVPSGNSGTDYLLDFPGDIIRMHREEGWNYVARYHVWKEPLAVRNRTMAKNLAHKTIVDDSSRCSVASADYLLVFRRNGENPIPIAHPVGLLDYAGERVPPVEVLKYRGWQGNQIENRYSHWIWRQYASAFWDDIRLDRVLPFKEARDEEDEKHVHPLQLDVIDRAVTLWTNPGETVLTPFMGVGSEAYAAIKLGRRAIGIELKPSYYRQAVRNLRSVREASLEQGSLLDDLIPIEAAELTHAQHPRPGEACDEGGDDACADRERGDGEAGEGPDALAGGVGSASAETAGAHAGAGEGGRVAFDGNRDIPPFLRRSAA